MRTQWNDQEDEALQGLPWLAQLLYLRGLRPYMDYASGVVGVKRGVSYQGLAETLYREPGQGKTEFGPPTLKALRHAVSILERAGLLVKIPADHRLIFQLVLATRDDSVQKKWGTFGADLGQTRKGTENNNQNIDLEDKRGMFGADPDPEKWGTPPVSGIRKESITTVAPVVEAKTAKTARGARLQLSALPDDWKAWAIKERPDLNADTTWQTFYDYWIAIPGQKGCKSDWLATWRNWVRTQRTQQKSIAPGEQYGTHRESSAARFDRLNRLSIEELYGQQPQRTAERVVTGEIL